MVSDALEGEIARVAALSFPDRGGVVPAAFDFGAAHDARGRQRVCVFLTGHVERNGNLSFFETNLLYRLKPRRKNVYTLVSAFCILGSIHVN